MWRCGRGAGRVDEGINERRKRKKDRPTRREAVHVRLAD